MKIIVNLMNKPITKSVTNFEYCARPLNLGTQNQNQSPWADLYKHTYNQVGRVFANGPGDRGSIPGYDIPKTKKNGT